MDDISLALNPPRFVKFKKKRPIRLARSASPVWPLPALNGREPAILESKGRGIELAYPRSGAEDAAAACPPGTPCGTATHLMPQMAAALAVDDGVIMFAGRHGIGYGMIIDHGNGFASYYANLKSIAAIRTDLYSPRDQYVRAGNVIGYVGAPEKDAFKRLYLELWERDRDRRFVPIDPRPKLGEWKLVRHYDHFTPAPPAAQKEAA